MEDYLNTAKEYAAIVPEIGTIYASIIDNPVAAFFCYIIGAIFAFGIVILIATRVLRTRWGSRLVSIIPNTLSTLGVLGTFTGILLGLLDFDVSEIDASIPRLLGGLTVAFSTSIVGMGSALIFRIFDALIPGRSSRDIATADDLNNQLKAIQKDNQSQANSLLTALSDEGAITKAMQASRVDASKQAEALETSLSEIRKALSSDSDSSLVTQIQKLRTTVQDGQNDLIREFRDFAKHMTENTNKVMIEALQDVIRDFNEKITEQFGDNFKELNMAVSALLIWQENYKDFVETTEQRISTAVGALESSEKAISAVKEHSAAIPAAIALLAPPLTTLNEQSKTLASHLDAVGGLREKALEAFPVLENNLKKMTDDLGEHVEKAINSTNEALERQRLANENLSTQFAQLSEESTNSQKAFSSELERALGKMAEETNAAFTHHTQLIDQSTKEVQRQIGDAWKRTEESINGRMETLDQEIQKELQRTLTIMGSNLASVSEKFVSDYTPLTERLREVVQIAQRAS